jgi:hypothetical protein
MQYRRLTWLPVVMCAIILGGVPFFFLFYSAIGSATFGLLILLTLIAIQYAAFGPMWHRLMRESESANDCQRQSENCDCEV